MITSLIVLTGQTGSIGPHDCTQDKMTGPLKTVLKKRNRYIRTLEL